MSGNIFAVDAGDAVHAGIVPPVSKHWSNKEEKKENWSNDWPNAPVTDPPPDEAARLLDSILHDTLSGGGAGQLLGRDNFRDNFLPNGARPAILLRENSAQIRQPRPDSGLVVQVNLLTTFYGVPSSLGNHESGRPATLEDPNLDTREAEPGTREAKARRTPEDKPRNPKDEP